MRKHVRPGRRLNLPVHPQELDQKLDPRRFVRVHRSTIVNLNHVQELHKDKLGL